MSFTTTLLRWFDINKRDLPWKHTKDAYKIWLSEIILQQTRVSQGLPYYERFIKKYTTVHQLANAHIDEVLKLWEGLGYYSRARNMHYTAQIISQKYKGKFPDSYEELIKLKGIGAYTAAAILSFAFDKPIPAIDGNALRVVSRYTGILDAIDDIKTKTGITQWLTKNISKKRPGDFNQAIMDLGSLICTPKKPDCISCPLNKHCEAFHKELMSFIPYKAKFILRKERNFHYMVLIDKTKNIIIKKRNYNDIWQGLFDFVLIENTSSDILSEKVLVTHLKEKFGIISTGGTIKTSESQVQLLTHQKILTRFYIIETKSLRNKELPNGYNLVNLENITTFAFPKLVQNFINQRLLSDYLGIRVKLKK